eukprot:scaffold138_cov396-Prasinococcus_capsulatus_cf.AAC.5
MAIIAAPAAVAQRYPTAQQGRTGAFTEGVPSADGRQRKLPTRAIDAYYPPAPFPSGSVQAGCIHRFCLHEPFHARGSYIGQIGIKT